MSNGEKKVPLDQAIANPNLVWNTAESIPLPPPANQVTPAPSLNPKTGKS